MTRKTGRDPKTADQDAAGQAAVGGQVTRDKGRVPVRTTTRPRTSPARTGDAITPRTAPFEVSLALARIREAVRPFPKAALFQLAADGHTSVFEQLVACVISVRTFDEVTLPTAKRLFAAAPTPATMATLSVEEIDELIRPSTFHEAKAPQLHALAARTATEFGGALPCDRDVLLSFRGVGPKCANLVLGIACDQPFVSVDVHVHRVVNRWGYVATDAGEDNARPERAAAEEILDRVEQPARAVRQARLYRAVAEMFDVPGTGPVPAGRGDRPPLTYFSRTRSLASTICLNRTRAARTSWFGSSPNNPATALPTFPSGGT
jgi:endonuclease-3